MQRLYVVGIGAGDPDQVTIQAVKAINKIDTFIVIGKGVEKQELLDVRTAILGEHAHQQFRVIELPDPPRDRRPGDYPGTVDRWHAERAERVAKLFDEIEGVGGILVWGDPALYDSTLRVVERSGFAGEVVVIPGVTAVSALCARHGIVLNRIGEPVLITTARRLRARWDGTDAVVMLDADCAFLDLPDDVQIWWGAYLGMPDEMLFSGRVGDVGPQIKAARDEARARKGWIMDIYLLRR
ncbi:MAG: precorrin-6A synthase (deacetylating) [Nocardiaceae bacterium]|nr:precorrin-6A synthase (deacetylating) [Nocardiaceae bacterium]